MEYKTDFALDSFTAHIEWSTWNEFLNYLKVLKYLKVT